MMDGGGVEVDGKSDEAMLKVICETDAGRMNHVICIVPSDVLSPPTSLQMYVDFPDDMNTRPTDTDALQIHSVIIPNPETPTKR